MRVKFVKWNQHGVNFDGNSESMKLNTNPDFGCCDAFRYRQDPWHPITLPLDLSCRHVVQRLVLVFTSAEQQIWVLLVKGGLLIRWKTVLKTFQMSVTPS